VAIRVLKVGFSSVVFATFTFVAAARGQAPLELPVFEPPSGSVAPFVLQAGDRDRARAVQCLTQAIYYEAASEPRAGQEAVAQVVLNRLKHPAFPKTVCGVVYEGSDRRTGCQFTFTCDGSLARTPVLWRWDAAEQVAAAALSGHVANEVGASTHYHAAWMTPYWSASLVRTQKIGGHVFYRMPGVAGTPEALNGTYSGVEPATQTTIARADPLVSGKSRHTATPPRSGVSQFSVWGLDIATVSSRRGVVRVQGGS
jgi:hypothetical protein